MANRVQLTTDGHSAYLSAVGPAFGYDVDYAQLVKIYGAPSEGRRRYSPAALLRTETNDIIGQPDAKHISTSFAERANLMMRMNRRRFTAAHERLLRETRSRISNRRLTRSCHDGG